MRIDVIMLYGLCEEKMMAVRTMLMPAVCAALMIYSSMTHATDQERTQEAVQTQKQVLGRELMTDQERAEHHARMKAAKTQEEREQIRREQHERMKKRAGERGLSIPDEPPEKRRKRDHSEHSAHDGGGKRD